MDAIYQFNHFLQKKTRQTLFGSCNVFWVALTCTFFLQDFHGPEDREMLARLAASAEDDQSADSDAAIEKYLRSVLSVENILTLDRLRQVWDCSSWWFKFVCILFYILKFTTCAFYVLCEQEVAVREQLSVRGKAAGSHLSSPDVHRVRGWSLSAETCRRNLWGFSLDMQ